ncbi:MAG: hypothetical protein L0206_17395 [Actinobacteria bacterium]|nr:hypothetical protein [Actinomycetota bacterium]
MLAAEAFELVFRVIHIMFGVAWAGAAFLFTVFIEPAAASLGPAAGPFMEEVVGRRKVPEIITVVAAVAVSAAGCSGSTAGRTSAASATGSGAASACG